MPQARPQLRPPAPSGTTGLPGFAGIVITADFHSNLEAAERLYLSLKARKSEGWLIADGGDFFQNSNPCSGGRWDDLLFDRLYDVCVPGNHGFSRCMASQHPRLLASNLVWGSPDGGQEPGILMIAVGRWRVALLGGIGSQAFDAVPKGQRRDISSSQLPDVVRSLTQRMKDEADIFICVSHSGADVDLDTLSGIDGLDLVVSSHCHSSFQRSVKHGVLFVKPKEYGEGYLEISVTEDGALEVSHTVPEASRAVAADDVVEAIRTARDQEGKAETRVQGFWTGKPLSREHLSFQFGDFLRHRYSTPVILNVSMFRAGLPSGPINARTLEAIAPYPNNIVRLSIGDFSEIARMLRANCHWKAALPLELDCPRSEGLLTTSYIFENFIGEFAAAESTVVAGTKDLLLDYINESSCQAKSTL
jgi:5'-nucleotidase/UDP-sugar diphosphatase